MNSLRRKPQGSNAGVPALQVAVRRTVGTPQIAASTDPQRANPLPEGLASGRPALRAGRFSAGSLLLDGRLGDPPLPYPLRSYLRHPKFIAQVAGLQVLVNAG
jgi:hypothetical protein